jgi:hypothetical protein
VQRPGFKPVADCVSPIHTRGPSAARSRCDNMAAIVAELSSNVFRAEQRHLPHVRSLIVADEIRITVCASQCEVPVVGRKPRVEHFGHGDATVTKDQCAWCLLAAVACIALDTDTEQRLFGHPIIIAVITLGGDGLTPSQRMATLRD